MGDKSTLLRQVCIGVIMAHLGCYVPASSFTLSPIDRIFTRLGAYDNIFAKKSTYMVEVAETAQVLLHATAKSLIILDELGRGTSTYDGYALAYAVITKLVCQNSAVIMSTHYHMLCEDLALEYPSQISLQHMAAFVESSVGSATDDKSMKSADINDCVTYLYKMKEGVCPKSYGLNVAAMAGIPLPIRQRASEISKEFNKTTQSAIRCDQCKALFQLLLQQQNSSNMETVRDIWVQTKMVLPELHSNAETNDL